MSKSARPSGRSLFWMAGVSLVVILAYERAKGGAALSPRTAAAARGARRAP